MPKLNNNEVYRLDRLDPVVRMSTVPRRGTWPGKDKRSDSWVVQDEKLSKIHFEI